MDFNLTEEQENIRMAVRDFAEREIKPLARELGEGGPASLFRRPCGKRVRVRSKCSFRLCELDRFRAFAEATQWLRRWCLGERSYLAFSFAP